MLSVCLSLSVPLSLFLSLDVCVYLSLVLSAARSAVWQGWVNWRGSFWRRMADRQTDTDPGHRGFVWIDYSVLSVGELLSATG